LLYSVRTEADEEIAVRVLRDRRVDGFVFMSGSDMRRHDHLLALLRAGVPLVVINRDLEAPGLMAVRFDNRGGAAEATRHLAALGHRRIAHLAGTCSGNAPRFSAVERRDGYLRALAHAGLPLLPGYVVESDYSFDDGLLGAAALLALRPRPTAILAASEVLALAVMRIAAESGLRVPSDLSVVGFGDPVFARYATPPLTSVQVPVTEAGRRATELLLEHLRARNGGTDPAPNGRGGASDTATAASTRGRTVVLPTRLILRGTTAPPPAA
jgi:LacI family transcriptional regulator